MSCSTDYYLDHKPKQACSVCMRLLPLDEETFDFCPRCGRIVCKEKCARICPFCHVSRCVVCLEEIHGNAYGASCESCASASSRKERR